MESLKTQGGTSGTLVVIIWPPPPLVWVGFNSLLKSKGAYSMPTCNPGSTIPAWICLRQNYHVRKIAGYDSSRFKYFVCLIICLGAIHKDIHNLWGGWGGRRKEFPWTLSSKKVPTWGREVSKYWKKLPMPFMDDPLRQLCWIDLISAYLYAIRK